MSVDSAAPAPDRRRRTPAIGLRARVAAVVVLVAVGSVAIVAVAIFTTARDRLISQRVDSVVSSASRNAVWLSERLNDPSADVVGLLADVSREGERQRFLLADEVTVSGLGLVPSQLPQPLVSGSMAEGQVLSMRFRQAGVPYVAVGIHIRQGRYIEVTRLELLDSTLRFISGSLVLAILGSAVVSAAGGVLLARRLLKPVRALADASRQLAAGDMSVRMAPSGDPDIEPISEAFNDMANSVSHRVERERRFGANVSHELMTPVAVMQATLDVVSAKTQDAPDEQRSLIAHAAEHAERLARLTSDLLELHRLEWEIVNEPDEIDIASLISDVALELSMPVRVVASGPVIVPVDARHLRRILANLFLNARLHAGGIDRVSLRERSGRILIDVEDLGPGLPPKMRQQVFEPFVRGTTGAAGSGLGLAIVAQHAAAIGGSVTLLPREPAGLIARIEFPGAEVRGAS
jgi:two-component system, OmpR family, sensor histidine kinase MtrB